MRADKLKLQLHFPFPLTLLLPFLISTFHILISNQKTTNPTQNHCTAC